MKLIRDLSESDREEIEEVLCYAKLASHPVLTFDIMKIYQDVILKQIDLQVTFKHETDMFCFSFNRDEDDVTIYYYPEDEVALTTSTYGGVTFSSSNIYKTLFILDADQEQNIESLVVQLNEYNRFGVLA